MEERLDFPDFAERFAKLGNRAQATLMYLLIERMSPPVLRSVIRYCHRQLDRLNEHGQTITRDVRYYPRTPKDCINPEEVEKW